MVAVRVAEARHAVNPSGKLPCVFAARAEDLPAYEINAKAITYDLWHGYRKLERDGAAPAFPFGFGLSYTTFALGGLAVEPRDGGISVALDVTNTGPTAGAAVAQVYIAVPNSRVERAPRELKGFQRVELAPGETKRARIDIPAQALAYYDEQHGWTVEPATYTVIAGQHSLDADALRAELRLG